jgi:hypothetical protein
MSFIRDLLKKMAERDDPVNWGIAQQEPEDPVLLVITYHLEPADLAMLHVIDEDDGDPLVMRAGQ